jgi:membrane associated rhomboid family serine protease
MASGPDLFVVCKSCGSEVSPYITECPYCGNRLRKRAPKLEKGGRPKEPKAPRRVRPSLGRLRPGEMPGVRMHAGGKPWAPALLVVAALLVTLGWKATLWDITDLIVLGDLGTRFWSLITTSFVYESTGYQVAALAAIFIFGWLLGRRHGAWAPLVVYALGCLAGFGAVVLLDEGALAVGGNAPALALLGAWAVRDLLARRHGDPDDDDSDMLGVLVFAAVLVLLPLAVTEAHALAGLAGGVAGLVLGFPLARMRER